MNQQTDINITGHRTLQVNTKFTAARKGGFFIQKLDKMPGFLYIIYIIVVLQVNFIYFHYCIIIQNIV